MTRASTGVPGLDAIIDDLRVGDNVVWQVDSEADFAAVAEPFVGRALAEGRRVLYLSFGQRPPLLDDLAGVEVHTLDPFAGFEPFAIAVHDLLAEVGRLGFYVIDPLSDLHRAWRSDLMVANFFRATCPFLFELDTIAYFPLLRNRHSYATVAAIRETTQVLLDLHRIDDALYVQPLKVWQRHSPPCSFRTCSAAAGRCRSPRRRPPPSCSRRWPGGSISPRCGSRWSMRRGPRWTVPRRSRRPPERP